MLALDGLIGACAIAGACRPRSCSSPCWTPPTGTATAMAVTIAYPVLDIVLVALLVEAVALGGWVLTRALGAARRRARSRSRSPTRSTTRRSPRAPTSTAATSTSAGSSRCCSSAVAAWQPDRRRPARVRPRLAPARRAGRVRRRSRWASSFYAYAAQVNVVAMALACAALLAVIVRMVATFRENLAHPRRRAPRVGHGRADRPGQPPPPARRPRGAPRRRPAAHARALRPQRLQALQRHLRPPGRRRAAQPPRRPARVGASPATAAPTAWAATSSARCSADAADARPPRAGRGARSAERGEGFDVDASCGAVVAARSRPTRAAEALRLADARMYEQKRGGRADRRGARASTLLMRLLVRARPRAERRTSPASPSWPSTVAERLGLDRRAVRATSRIAAELHDVGKVADAGRDPAQARPARRGRVEPSCDSTRSSATASLSADARHSSRSRQARPLYRTSGYDGRGYPDKLAGDDIPLGARIVAVCDAFHAMTSDRPYRRLPSALRPRWPSSAPAPARSSTRPWSTPSWPSTARTRCPAPPDAPAIPPLGYASHAARGRSPGETACPARPPHRRSSSRTIRRLAAALEPPGAQPARPPAARSRGVGGRVRARARCCSPPPSCACTGRPRPRSRRPSRSRWRPAWAGPCGACACARS